MGDFQDWGMMYEFSVATAGMLAAQFVALQCDLRGDIACNLLHDWMFILEYSMTSYNI